MSKPVVVPSMIEPTSHVELDRAFEFWQSTALARFGDVDRQHPREPFSAKRLTVAMPDWILTHTISSPIGLDFRACPIDRNARDMVVIGPGNLAYRRLASPRHDARTVATIAYACGFTDIPTFNRAFRRRFDLSPRDLRASRA